jgi:hypothetical protein
MNTNDKRIPMAVIVVSIISGIGGGTLLLFFMILSFIGGVIGYNDIKKK